MKYVDLYVAEVGSHLPEKTRADIEKEIRSLIEDSLEDASRAQDRPIDEDLEVEVLKKLGSPAKLAESYLPARYLIGPELFPAFLSVLRVVLPITAVVVVMVIGLSLGRQATSWPDLARAIGGGMSARVDALVHAVAIVVVIFAILQWAVPGFKVPASQWDPRQLRPLSDPERVKIADAVIGIVAAVAAMTIFNLYPDWIAVWSYHDGVWSHAPVLNEVFFRYLPWLTILWALQIGHSVWLLSQGRWTTALRWADLGINGFNVLLLAVWLTGPMWIALNAQSLERLGWGNDPAAAARVADGLYLAARFALGIGLVVTLVEIMQQFYRLVIRDRLPATMPVR